MKNTIWKIDIFNDFLLLLTASININGMLGVTRVSSIDREKDYIDALNYYVSNHPKIKKIAFIENSGWPLDNIKCSIKKNPYNKDITFISMNCNNFPRHLGKSYGEMLLLNKAMEMPIIYNNAKFIGKITGRNYLLNITELLSSVDKDFDLLCDIRDHGIYEFFHIPANGRHCDTRFLVFTVNFFKENLNEKYKQLNDESGQSIETLFYNIIKQSKRKKICYRFPIEPVFSGMAGHWNKSYDSAYEQFKRLIRSGCRYFFPWLHV